MAAEKYTHHTLLPSSNILQVSQELEKEKESYSQNAILMQRKSLVIRSRVPFTKFQYMGMTEA